METTFFFRNNGFTIFEMSEADFPERISCTIDSPAGALFFFKSLERRFSSNMSVFSGSGRQYMRLCSSVNASCVVVVEVTFGSELGVVMEEAEAVESHAAAFCSEFSCFARATASFDDVTVSSWCFGTSIEVLLCL